MCEVSFPAVPAGQRLVVTYASAIYGLSPGGTGASVRLSNGGSDEILLPAAVRTGFDTHMAAGPVSFYVEAGGVPTLELSGQYTQPASLTATAAVVGYLVPAT